jgi:hypothetical protein
MMITAAETYRLLYARDSSSVMQRCGFVFGISISDDYPGYVSQSSVLFVSKIQIQRPKIC